MPTIAYFSHHHVPKSTQKFDARTDQRLRERSSSRPECKIVSHPETDNLRAQKRHRTSEFQAAARGNAEAWTAVLLCGRRKIVNYAFLLPSQSRHRAAQLDMESCAKTLEKSPAQLKYCAIVHFGRMQMAYNGGTFCGRFAELGVIFFWRTLYFIACLITLR